MPLASGRVILKAMIPFRTVPFEYEGYAYGKHYAIHLADGKDGWLATCFVRFTPTDRW